MQIIEKHAQTVYIITLSTNGNRKKSQETILLCRNRNTKASYSGGRLSHCKLFEVGYSRVNLAYQESTQECKHAPTTDARTFLLYYYHIGKRNNPVALI